MSSPATVNRPLPVPPPPMEVYDGTGPFVSVYLATPGALPDAAEQVARRWRAERRGLAADGAPEAVLTEIDPFTVDAHTTGQTLVAIASPDGLRYRANLPEPPKRDLASVGELPHLVPLLAATQRMLPYLVVVTDRIGAELIVIRPDEIDLHAEVTGDDLHVTRSAPGGWSQRRFQQRAENRWEANAAEVAGVVTRLVDQHNPRLVVVSGDVRAVQFLRDQLPGRVNDLITEVQGDYQDLDEALGRAAALVDERVEADTGEVLADYRRELGQRRGLGQRLATEAPDGDAGRDRSGLAVAGPEDTLDALAAGKVATLLLDLARLPRRDAWFGPGPAEVAVSAHPLRMAGVAEPRSAPLVDVAVRAALGTGATVRIVPAAATGRPDPAGTEASDPNSAARSDANGTGRPDPNSAGPVDASGIAALLRYR